MVTLMSLGNFISHLIVMYTMVEISLGAVSRLKSFHDTVLPESTPEEDAELPSLWPWRGAVDIQDVSASYRYVKLGNCSIIWFIEVQNC